MHDSSKNVDLLEASANEEAEARIDLRAKMKEGEDLKRTCTNQEKSMSKLRVDLKTLSHDKRKYVQIARKRGEADTKREARTVSARGA